MVEGKDFLIACFLRVKMNYVSSTIMSWVLSMISGRGGLGLELGLEGGLEGGLGGGLGGGLEGSAGGFGCGRGG